MGLSMGVLLLSGLAHTPSQMPVYPDRAALEAVNGAQPWEQARVLNDGYGRPAVFAWDPYQRKGDWALSPRWEREDERHVLFRVRQRVTVKNDTAERDIITYMSSWMPDHRGFFGIRSYDIHRNRLWKAIHSFAFQVGDLSDTCLIRFYFAGTNWLTFALRPSDWTGMKTASDAAPYNWYPGWIEQEVYFNTEPSPSQPLVGWYARVRVFANVWRGQLNPGPPLYDAMYAMEESRGVHDSRRDFPLAVTAQWGRSDKYTTFAANYTALVREF